MKMSVFVEQAPGLILFAYTNAPFPLLPPDFFTWEMLSILFEIIHTLASLLNVNSTQRDPFVLKTYQINSGLLSFCWNVLFSCLSIYYAVYRTCTGNCLTGIFLCHGNPQMLRSFYSSCNNNIDCRLKSYVIYTTNRLLLLFSVTVQKCKTWILSVYQM